MIPGVLFVCVFLRCLMKVRGCKTLSNKVTLRYMKIIADPVRKQEVVWSGLSQPMVPQKDGT